MWAAPWAGPLVGKSCPGAWFLLLAPGRLLATLSSVLCLHFLICKVEAVKLTPWVTMKVSDTKAASTGLRRGPWLGVGSRTVRKRLAHRICCNWEKQGSGPGHSWSSSLTPSVHLPRQAAFLGNTDLLGLNQANTTEAGLVGDPLEMRVISSPSTFCKFSPRQNLLTIHIGGGQGALCSLVHDLSHYRILWVDRVDLPFHS